MRGLLVVATACGGAAPAAQKPVASAPQVARHAGGDPAPVDAIAALAPGGDVAWIAPGTLRLELGGAATEAPEGAQALAVGLIEAQGNDVHVAVRLDHARFAAWTDRAHLYGVITRDQRTSTRAGSVDWVEPGQQPVEAVLHAGAHVRRLAHKAGWTQVRYLGALEVEGWIPDDALADRGPERDPVGRFPTGKPTLMVIPGAIVRGEPKWSARELAIVATGYFLDNLHEIDDAWVEVGYADSDVTVHGYLSRHDPPGHVHRPRESDVPPTSITANAAAPSGTCLYARAGGEPVGYLVGDRAIELADSAQHGWFALAIDTPWGALTFAAKGASRSELEACAPPGSVPAPATQTIP